MWRPLAILFLAAVNLQAAATEIRDTIYTGFSGVLFAGRMTIDSPAMTTGDGRTVQRWQRTYTITAGVISVDLEPNSTATPASTSYYVVYRPTSGLARISHRLRPTCRWWYPAVEKAPLGTTQAANNRGNRRRCRSAMDGGSKQEVTPPR